MSRSYAQTLREALGNLSTESLQEIRCGLIQSGHTIGLCSGDWGNYLHATPTTPRVGCLLGAASFVAGRPETTETFDNRDGAGVVSQVVHAFDSWSERPSMVEDFFTTRKSYLLLKPRYVARLIGWVEDILVSRSIQPECEIASDEFVMVG